MSVEAIKDRLLSAVGVGIALADADTGEIVYANSSFKAWFKISEPRQPLSNAIPDLDLAAISAKLREGGREVREISIRPKRRVVTINASFSLSQDGERSFIAVECENITRVRELEAMIDSYAKMMERNNRDLEREKERVERLLLNIMPREAYEEFKAFGVVTPQLYPDVSVLMLDFVGFTKFSAETDPTITLSELNEIFTAFDRIAEQFGCERIKTIGDGYLAVAGMPTPNPDHARAVARCGVRFLRFLERRNQTHRYVWQARIGLASGAAVGSVVGVQRYVYDVFGPAVNMAARLQAYAEPMTVIAHAAMRDELIDEFTLGDLGRREVRGFGEEPLMEVRQPMGARSF